MGGASRRVCLDRVVGHAWRTEQLGQSQGLRGVGCLVHRGEERWGEGCPSRETKGDQGQTPLENPKVKE